ncbi:MAG TPA: hypothetical protein DEB40_02185 [Elusimicrobia bacterium]|nr:hypothetical protein [Elusimicrobiota bacterium]HBT60538.1 hypothetical protein [Elusimicrobiota bacterium]
MPADWLDRVEKRLGFLSLPGLPAFLAGMNAAVGVLTLFKPDFAAALDLDPSGLKAGEFWRVISFLFIPTQTAPLWLAVWVVLLYSLMRGLEAAWGDFRLTVFWLTGAAAMALAAVSCGTVLSNGPLLLSLGLAFAQVYPDMQLMLFFIFPVKVRWLAALGWAWAAWGACFGDATTRVAILAGLANYALFFGSGHWQQLRRHLRRASR